MFVDPDTIFSKMQISKQVPLLTVSSWLDQQTTSAALSSDAACLPQASTSFRHCERLLSICQCNWCFLCDCREGPQHHIYSFQIPVSQPSIKYNPLHTHFVLYLLFLSQFFSFSPSLIKEYYTVLRGERERHSAASYLRYAFLLWCSEVSLAFSGGQCSVATLWLLLI